jgi:hypothetical protein
MGSEPQRGRIPDNQEEKLLAFLEELIIDLAKTHPAITQQHLAGWLGAVVVGCPRRTCR